MTGGVDELEAFIAALRLSSLISSTSPGSSESLQEGIAAFRQALRPQSDAETGTASTEEYTPRQDDALHSSASVFTQAGEPISSTSTGGSSDDGIDRPKQIGLVNTVTEVREGTSEIRDLIQSVNELREEIVNLCSAFATSNNVNPGSALPSTGTRLQPASSATTSNSNPNFTSSISLFTPTKASLATGASTVPPAPTLSQALSSTPCLATSLGPAFRPTAVPVEPVCPSESTSPVTEDAPEIVLPKSTDHKSPSPNARMNDCPSQPLVGESVAKEMEGKTCVSTFPSNSVHQASMNVPPIMTLEADDPKLAVSSNKPQGNACQLVSSSESKHGVVNTNGSEACDPIHEDKIEGKDVNSPDSKDGESHSKSPVIATAISSYSGIGEELSFQYGDQITIIESPNTPAGWMYGERVELTRRGIFLARHVREMSDLEAKGVSGNAHFLATEPTSGSTAIRVATRYYTSFSKGELSIRAGDRIAILESPDIPDGWLYGEIVEKRRGIFPARHVTINKA